jgi:dolichol-phosphate mannosyltransferase
VLHNTIISNQSGLIIIPTYNERDNIVKLIKQILYLPILVDILVIDDNSPDGTGSVIEAVQQKNLRIKLLKRSGKLGLGTAYIEGFKFALEQGYKFIVTMDADFSHDPKYIPELINNLNNHDLIIGSRYIKNGGVKNWPLKRRLLSRLGNFYAKIILHTPINDNTAGFMAMRLEILQKINLDKIHGRGYAFLVELKYALFRQDAKIVELPIIFVERILGKSKISSNIIKEGLIMPWVLKIQYRKK